MIVIDEIDVAVVDSLVIRHVRVRRVDAHGFGDDFAHRPALLYELVIDIARALLVAVENALFKLGVQRFRLRSVDDRALHVVGHGGSYSIVRLLSDPAIASAQGREPEWCSAYSWAE